MLNSQRYDQIVSFKNDVFKAGKDIGYPHLDDLLRFVDGRYIQELLDQKELYTNDIAFLSAQKSQVVTGQTVTSLIIQMSMIVRDMSHGGCVLDRVYISKENYQEIVQKCGGTEKTGLKVARIPVYTLYTKVDCDVLGICRPKFKFIDPSFLVIKGKLNEPERPQI